MLSDGTINGKTFFWMCGMSAWLPLGEYLLEKERFIESASLYKTKEISKALPSIHQETRLPDEPSRMVSTRFLTNIFTGLSLAGILFEVLRNSWSIFTTIPLFETPLHGAIATLLQLLVTCTLVVVLITWTYRTNKNSHLAGAEGMRFSPGWACFWWVIPIACFFVPFLVMQELWETSVNPHDWKKERSSQEITWSWITLFIVPLLFPSLFLLITEIFTPDNPNAFFYPWFKLMLLLSIMSGAISGLLIIRVVRDISSRQEALIPDGR